jgi:hypothetical protein
MTIYNCVYKTITSPNKIKKLHRSIKDASILDNIIEKYLDDVLEKYDNCIQFCNLKRTFNMLKDSYVVAEDVTYDTIQKRLSRKGCVYICSLFDLDNLVIVKIWR